jgi:hypothetical protein
MDTLKELIQQMTKAEVRHFKLFARRGHDREDRKDLLLYEWIRQGNDSAVKEDEWIAAHYSPNGKNAYYRLRNRLLEEVNKSIWLQHFEKNNLTLAYYYYSLARLHMGNERLEPALHALKRAEKLGKHQEMFELLDLVYSFYIELAPQHPFINPEKYIQLRKDNRRKMEAINRFDDLLAMITYRLGTAQNRSVPDRHLLKTLQATVDEYGSDDSFTQSPKFRIKIFDAVSKILLQEIRYGALESYLSETYRDFTESQIFTKHTHDVKVRMLAYLVNTFFCTQKHDESLSWAEQLKDALEEYDRQQHEAFGFFYYNALVLNYSVLDPARAITILTDLKSKPGSTPNAFNRIFISLNLAVNHYNLGHFSKALRSLIDLYLYDENINADRGLKLRLELFELILRYKLEAYEILEKRFSQVEKDYADLLSDTDMLKDIDFMDILKRLLNQKMKNKPDKLLRRNMEHFLDKYEKTAFQGVNIFAYEVFVKQELGTDS